MKLTYWLPGFCILLFWAASIQNPLFWDTIQFGAYHPTYFFKTNFSSFFLPEHLDSGHPPYFGIYLAFCWKILGRELWVTHLAMLPFVCGIGYFLARLSAFFKTSIFAWCIAGFPVVLGQIMLVSPDVVMLMAWLSCIYYILTRQNRLIILAVLLLGMVSTRGMLAALGLFFWQCWLFRKEKKPLQILLLYVPSGLLAITYFTIHYLKTGWIGYHANSTWADSFLRADTAGFLKNVIVLGWRLVDFGLVFIWLAIFYILLRQSKPLKDWFVSFGHFGVLFLVNALLFAAIMLPYVGLMGHRYLLPVYASLLLCFGHLVAQSSSKRVVAIALAGLFSGNGWFYPQPIATGWDCTPLHTFYFPIRRACIEYLQQKEIPLQSVGSAFPNLDKLYITDLYSNNHEKFSMKDLAVQRRIFYCNVFNNFSKAELNDLRTNWVVERQWGNWPVFGVLYQKPASAVGQPD